MRSKMKSVVHSVDFSGAARELSLSATTSAPRRGKASSRASIIGELCSVSLLVPDVLFSLHIAFSTACASFSLPSPVQDNTESLLSPG